LHTSPWHSKRTRDRRRFAPDIRSRARPASTMPTYVTVYWATLMPSALRTMACLRWVCMLSDKEKFARGRGFGPTPSGGYPELRRDLGRNDRRRDCGEKSSLFGSASAEFATAALAIFAEANETLSTPCGCRNSMRPSLRHSGPVFPAPVRQILPFPRSPSAGCRLCHSRR
jgi:hypothetical protein